MKNQKEKPPLNKEKPEKEKPEGNESKISKSLPHFDKKEYYKVLNDYKEEMKFLGILGDDSKLIEPRNKDEQILKENINHTMSMMLSEFIGDSKVDSNRSIQPLQNLIEKGCIVKAMDTTFSKNIFNYRKNITASYSLKNTSNLEKNSVNNERMPNKFGKSKIKAETDQSANYRDFESILNTIDSYLKYDFNNSLILNLFEELNLKDLSSFQSTKDFSNHSNSPNNTNNSNINIINSNINKSAENHNGETCIINCFSRVVQETVIDNPRNENILQTRSSDFELNSQNWAEIQIDHKDSTADETYNNHTLIKQTHKDIFSNDNKKDKFSHYNVILSKLSKFNSSISTNFTQQIRLLYDEELYRALIYSVNKNNKNFVSGIFSSENTCNMHIEIMSLIYFLKKETRNDDEILQRFQSYLTNNIPSISKVSKIPFITKNKIIREFLKSISLLGYGKNTNTISKFNLKKYLTKIFLPKGRNRTRDKKFSFVVFSMIHLVIFNKFNVYLDQSLLQRWVDGYLRLLKEENRSVNQVVTINKKKQVSELKDKVTNVQNKILRKEKVNKGDTTIKKEISESQEQNIDTDANNKGAISVNENSSLISSVNFTPKKERNKIFVIMQEQTKKESLKRKSSFNSKNNFDFEEPITIPAGINKTIESEACILDCPKKSKEKESNSVSGSTNLNPIDKIFFGHDDSNVVNVSNIATVTIISNNLEPNFNLYMKNSNSEEENLTNTNTDLIKKKRARSKAKKAQEEEKTTTGENIFVSELNNSSPVEKEENFGGVSNKVKNFDTVIKIDFGSPKSDKKYVLEDKEEKAKEDFGSDLLNVQTTSNILPLLPQYESEQNFYEFILSNDQIKYRKKKNLEYPKDKTTKDVKQKIPKTPKQRKNKIAVETNPLSDVPQIQQDQCIFKIDGISNDFLSEIQIVRPNNTFEEKLIIQDSEKNLNENLQNIYKDATDEIFRLNSFEKSNEFQEKENEVNVNFNLNADVNVNLIMKDQTREENKIFLKKEITGNLNLNEITNVEIIGKKKRKRQKVKKEEDKISCISKISNASKPSNISIQVKKKVKTRNKMKSPKEIDKDVNNQPCNGNSELQISKDENTNGVNNKSTNNKIFLIYKHPRVQNFREMKEMNPVSTEFLMGADNLNEYENQKQNSNWNSFPRNSDPIQDYPTLKNTQPPDSSMINISTSEFHNDLMKNCGLDYNLFNKFLINNCSNLNFTTQKEYECDIFRTKENCKISEENENFNQNDLTCTIEDQKDKIEFNQSFTHPKDLNSKFELQPVHNEDFFIGNLEKSEITGEEMSRNNSREEVNRFQNLITQTVKNKIKVFFEKHLNTMNGVQDLSDQKNYLETPPDGKKGG